MNAAKRLKSPALLTPYGRPNVWLIGQSDHADFRQAVAMLRADAELTVVADVVRATAELTQTLAKPELIALAQSRPDAVAAVQVKRLQRAAPLAGVAALLGSWCEGYGRTGRSWPGTARLYWHEFGPWWQRQLALRADKRCPDWSRSGDFGLISARSVETRISSCRSHSTRNPQGVHLPGRAIRKVQSASGGLIILAVPRWETADALADVLASAGFASVWQPPGSNCPAVRGIVAGVWEGGQLSSRETAELSTFCARLQKVNAPVLALLDFPRLDTFDRALESGAGAILGKPWSNKSLVATLAQCIASAANTLKAPRAA